jgi:hypothetical protein
VVAWLGLREATDRILDGAISGAPTEIAFHRGGQVPALRLIQTRGCQHHSRRAEAALKTLRGEEAPLHLV